MAYIKLIGFVILVICYFITSIPFYIWGLIQRYEAKKHLTSLARIYAKLTLKLLQIEYSVLEKSEDAKRTSKIGDLIVSNHMSYIDALIMLAQRPVCFVTSIEMKRTPFLGQICEAAGCLYVERRSRDNLSTEIEDITLALKHGLDVVIFPEATSTNGESIKRFKRPLFKAAIESGANIIPQTLNYISINNEPITAKNRDYACWYGDMHFLPHLLNVFRKKNFKFQIILNQYLEINPSNTIEELAETSRMRILENYIPIS